METVILNHQQITTKFNRIALEILEDLYAENNIILVGIKEGGFAVANDIYTILKALAPNKTIELHSIALNKSNPLNHPVECAFGAEQAEDKSVVLIDDVLNTGKTFMYAARYLTGLPIKQLKTVVLVNRKHTLFPVTADFVGLTLATTMQEHIHFDHSNAANYKAYLA